MPKFPPSFLWGVSTAAFQIEGATSEDGRGPSVWDTFTARQGAVRDGHTAETACDHYHRHAEDVALMAGLGLTGYRFSISWPRVQPDGGGAPNPKGLAFYDRLVDDLLGQGITPVPTLFHWDLPQALEDADGWLARDTAHRFADYAALVVEALGDRVKRWITLNEPFIHTVWGYGTGEHAPGRTLLFDCLPVAHHQLLGHGLAVRALRAAGATEVMISNNCTPVWSASESEADRAAARNYDILHNRLFLDPILLGVYPDLSAYGSMAAVTRDDDLEIIATPLDAIGINYYNPTLIAAPGEPGLLPFEVRPIEGVPRTAFDWPIVPDGLRELLTGLTRRYPGLPPVYITENGCSTGEGLHDPERVAYLAGHLAALSRAVEEGVDVRGYFTWTLMDNFEWAQGYHQHFGLVQVDRDTQRRTPRTSYRWYREHIAAQRG